MLRRLTVVLAGLVTAGFLATGAAAAAPADHHHGHRPQRESRHRLTPREREGLRIAGHVLDVLFGGPSRRDHMY
ncbi:hypothetical protein K2224_29650 (plasmid) [Streptomyces sp. BHT-5-2]|uniref:hypothetical protein n=1 Tax=unclassified Streptomyces TaxID=2593676 RepID=UPI001C8E5BFF|nr:hypothetical protein [Streptomyces sp. BHT-5-2]QZL07430.1 hypothetical protein K2224_29650 [Streptomyces sp. BHT-5-2]